MRKLVDVSRSYTHKDPQKVLFWKSDRTKYNLEGDPISTKGSGLSAHRSN